jgi:hypothetical protein
VGRDSSVVIVNRYGLDGPGIESRRVAISVHFQTGPMDHPASYTMSTESFPGVKRPGHGADHLPHLAPRLKKEYTTTFTPPSGPSRPLLGWIWPLLLPATFLERFRSKPNLFWQESDTLDIHVNYRRIKFSAPRFPCLWHKCTSVAHRYSPIHEYNSTHSYSLD